MLMISQGPEEVGNETQANRHSALLGPSLSKLLWQIDKRWREQRTVHSRSVFARAEHFIFLLNFLWPDLNHMAIPKCNRC